LAPGVCGDPPAIRLHSLGQGPLTWFPQPALDPSGAPVAEILLSQASPSGSPPAAWGWVRRLLAAGPFDNSFTIDPALYRPIALNADNTVQYEYDGDGADSVRFGDGQFGANPDPGMVFTATYRFGAGAGGNVAAGAISQLDPATIALGRYLAVMNPIAAAGGADPQSLQSVKRLAPQAFRVIRRRAVLADDYSAAARTQPWVKSAGAVFRWTGSWLTTFTTPEPVGQEQIPIQDRTSLIDLLNRYRMAGTESYVPDPIYLSIDLRIEVCAQPDAFAAGIRQAILAVLSPTGARAADAFFATSRFVFGQPLERSRLEAAIQAVPGVAGVTCVDYRLRDRFAGFLDMGDTVPVGFDQILRCDNDPSRPNNGALSITVRGGR
jgi:predicted phage baseplate assembly protein